MPPAHSAGTGLEPRAGRLLVAAPQLVDPNFVRTVVLLLDADDAGCLGVVLNRPGSIDVREVLPSWEDAVDAPRVLFAGGPVSTETALGVATLGDGPRAEPVGWRPLFEGCGLVDLDVPADIVRPALGSLRIYLGYAGWGAGQLEAEIAQGGWFVVPGGTADCAPGRPESLWHRVLRRQPAPLSWFASYPLDPTRN